MSPVIRHCSPSPKFLHSFLHSLSILFPVACLHHGSDHLQVKLMLGHFPCLVPYFSGDPIPLRIKLKFLTVVWKALVTEPHSVVQLHRSASEEAHQILAVWLSVSQNTLNSSLLRCYRAGSFSHFQPSSCPHSLLHHLVYSL